MSGPQAATAQLRFVGTRTRTRSSSQSRPQGPVDRRILHFMLAEEMQSNVAALTGYEHPAFEAFADLLGRFDPITGNRTNDRPTLLSVLCLRKIAVEIAEAVVQRETFLDDDERIVFRNMQLEGSPSDEDVNRFIGQLADRWVKKPLSPPVLTELLRKFRALEAAGGPRAGWAALLSHLIEHPALYYY